MRDLSANLTPRSARPTAVVPGDIVARIVNPAPEVAGLPAGETLRGRVIGRDEAGLLIIQTRLATIKLAAARSLPPGTEVLLQVRAGGLAAGVTIQPIEGPAVPAAPNGDDAAPLPGTPRPTPLATPAQAHPSASPVADSVSRGALMRAVLQAAPPLQLLAGLPSAEPGSELLVRVVAVGAAQGRPTGQGAPPANPAPARPGTPAGTPATGAAAGTVTGPGLPSGGAAPSTGPNGRPLPAAPAGPQSNAPPPAPTVPGQIPPTPPGAALPAPTPGPQSAAPPAQASQPSDAGLRTAPQTDVVSAGLTVKAALQGSSAEGANRAIGTAPGSSQAEFAPPDGQTLRLTGLVTGRGNAGTTVLHTPLGTLTLKAGAELPPGSSLALEVILPGAGRPAGAPPGLAQLWPGLDTMEHSLLTTLPPAQAEALPKVLPQAGPRLASGILFFLSAISQGAPLAWLAGPGVALERGERGELMERLGRELAGLSRSVETASGEWRLFHLPVWSGEGLRELRVFLRHHGGGEHGGEESDAKATRFVLELELQRHGELQLDGLVRGQTFDLLLRSRRRLPAVVRGDLIALFEETLAIAGYRGQLLFQASHDWKQLQADQAAAASKPGLKA